MQHDTEEKLARSLTAETVELLPHLPYLLQDLWMLGSDPQIMVDLIRRHVPVTPETTILDLACGKGPVAIHIAKALNVPVKGIDLIPAFIDDARQKAEAWQVSALCQFAVNDINEAVKTEHHYDAVIFGAAGNVLGTPQETIHKLINTLNPHGYLLIDEAYLADTATNQAVKYQNYDYLTRPQWMTLFQAAGLTLIEEVTVSDVYDFDADNQAIARRASELIEQYPEKRALFESYVQSQLNECDDLEDSLVGVTWILQKQ